MAGGWSDGDGEGQRGDQVWTLLLPAAALLCSRYAPPLPSRDLIMEDLLAMRTEPMHVRCAKEGDEPRAEAGPRIVMVNTNLIQCSLARDSDGGEMRHFDGQTTATGDEWSSVNESRKQQITADDSDTLR
ncbi:hypothetical protein EYF80_009346 [Liparis tanakae]|uniref:Uncharacterized protein n=1 Tax=Liparis tanakae TaxID=230148 RepID=A0A4Z2ISR2_9TELE|nr:hypothetical protein EYF80_009346 [Liparis tanakae]